MPNACAGAQQECPRPTQDYSSITFLAVRRRARASRICALRNGGLAAARDDAPTPVLVALPRPLPVVPAPNETPMPAVAAPDRLGLADIALCLRDGHAPYAFVAGHVLLLLQPLCWALGWSWKPHWIRVLTGFDPGRASVPLPTAPLPRQPPHADPAS